VGHIPVAKPSPILREWTFPRRGLLIGLLLLGIVALSGVVLATAWPRGVHVDQIEHTHWVRLASVDGLEVDHPVRNIEQRLWLVKLRDGSVIALSQKSTHLGCTVPWREEFVFDGVRGWFRDPCSGTTYDLNGFRVFGPAPRGLDQYPVRIVNGNIEVDVNPQALIENAPTGAKPYR
jgi:Rieske Fe-S protein